MINGYIESKDLYKICQMCEKSQLAVKERCPYRSLLNSFCLSLIEADNAISNFKKSLIESQIKIKKEV